jgi:hypothetical protein
VETQIRFAIFVFFAASSSGQIVHVVIVILGISPKWIVRVVYNGSRIAALTGRTRWRFWRTHNDNLWRGESDATMRAIRAIAVVMNYSSELSCSSIAKSVISGTMHTVAVLLSLDPTLKRVCYKLNFYELVYRINT